MRKSSKITEAPEVTLDHLYRAFQAEGRASKMVRTGDITATLSLVRTKDAVYGNTGIEVRAMAKTGVIDASWMLDIVARLGLIATHPPQRAVQIWTVPVSVPEYQEVA